MRLLHHWADGPRNIAIVSHVKKCGTDGCTRDELARDERTKAVGTLAGTLAGTEIRSTKKVKKDTGDVAPSPQSILDAFNKATGRKHELTPKRRIGTIARLKEPFFASNWQAAIAKVVSSPFCQGQNDRGWSIGGESSNRRVSEQKSEAEFLDSYPSSLMAFTNASKQHMPSTIHKRISFAKQFLQDAVDWEIIVKNPFAKIKTSTPSTKSKVEVNRETIDRLMPHCDPTWQLITALSRLWTSQPIEKRRNGEKHHQ